MDITVRRATANDAEFLAWVSLTAARSHMEIGNWDVTIGGREHEVLAFLERLAVTGDPHFFHWSTFTIAEVDGQPAAGLCGYDPTETGMAKVVAALIETNKVLGKTDVERDAAFARSQAFLSCAPDDSEGAWVLENVATVPRCRGRGLINTLLLRVLGEGRERGYELAQIGVLIDNTPAQRAYEGVGFKVVGEKRTDEFEATFGCPGIRKLLMEL